MTHVCPWQLEAGLEWGPSPLGAFIGSLAAPSESNGTLSRGQVPGKQSRHEPPVYPTGPPVL